MKRKEFIKLAASGALGLSSFGYIACEKEKELFFKLSLAQWSFHRAIQSGIMSPYTFAQNAKSLGFDGIEYVNALYDDVMKVENKSDALKNFIKKNNELAMENDIENVLIMIDSEGDLANEDNSERLISIDNHKRWIETGAEMNCSAVRLNLYGSKDVNTWTELSIESLGTLSEFASGHNINVTVENHGRITSNIPALMNVINSVNMDNCGTLPDFGNFCMADEGYGSVFDGTCQEAYDFYKGVEEMMPRALAVSAKSNDFDSEGNETTIDYRKMLEIVKSFGYNGFIGVEYEGNRLSEVQGIKDTRDLLIKIGKSI